MKKLKAVMHEMDATTWRRHWFKLRRGMLRTEQYQKLRARVVKRSGGFCESANCKRPGRHMHHVVTVYKRPDMSLDDNNVQFLCLKCHRRAHK